MTFTQLRILQAVARTGNMTRAAEELATTQSAVSHALRLLERELGLPLFIRGNQGVTLTPAGRTVSRRAALILTQLEALDQEVAVARSQSGGRLRIGVIPSANAHLLPSVLRAFTAAHPRVTLTVLEGSDPEVLDWLQTGAVDVATITTTAPHLTVTPFSRDRMLAVFPAAHRLSSRPAVTVADVARHPFIMSAGGCEPLIMEVVRRAGATLRCHYRVRETGSILAMVAEELGVSIIPELALPAQTTGICAIPLEPEETRTIMLGLPGDGAALPMAAAFTELALREVPPAYRCVAGSVGGRS
ncbi:DNA-binding transcriptional LysR family regulator [Streptosporangium becharense]|uniref:DNA-binding transcriptional LysR family regulator n=1 Tax=Streptosporangium becharense TaxID=1816182 RepID=A0A7W9ILL7_9ACTN|nr:LysR family transcriptional regulator [Streptosporangium becharense]MBB2910174.1 DNA-binding transcriptional LysR family regulator [Streptosporangium becharense]MBB5822917.1 DNA-binding transcriptional LysR family regulator [Streptosporangium becharense]